jgi:hypothetical protein
MFYLSAACSILSGCSDEIEMVAGCAAEDMIGDACAGVPVEDVCESDACVQGVSCAKVLNATNDAEVSAALMGASAGTCITLAPGTYGAVSLPGGVSLLGRSAAKVKVAGVVLGAGTGAVVRGLSAGDSGVRLSAGALDARLESLRIGGINDSVTFEPGSSGAIVTSEIAGSGRAGIFAEDADVTIDRSVVRDASASGVWIVGTGCDAACACTSRPTLTVTGSVIRKNHLLGISVRGAKADFQGVDIKDTLTGVGTNMGSYGGGLTAAACSDVTSKNLRVLGSKAWGVLIDASTATLGGDLPDEGVEISHNEPGLWIQNVKCVPDVPGGPCVMLHNGVLTANLGVGIGVAGQSQGIILCKSIVSTTQTVTMPVLDVNEVGALKEVGDGVDWLEESEVTIDGLTLSGNERHSLLIDGPTAGATGGKIWSITLEGGDEGKPPLQQHLEAGGQQPALSAGVSLATDSARKLAVPMPLSAPAGL